MATPAVHSKSTMWIFVVSAVIIALIAVIAGPAIVQKVRGNETVTLATASQPIGAVVCIAVEKGYLEKEGLTVNIQPYKSGKDALQAVLDGKADVCEVAETPVVFAVLRGNPVRIFGSVAWSQKNMAIIGRKDRGITTAAELKGKKIGVTLRTNGEFFLRHYLAGHSIPADEIQVENISPDAMVKALVNGDVDAVSTWNPHLATLQKTLGTDAATFYDISYVWTWNLTARPSTIEANPRTIRKILKAMVKASEFIRSNPREARAIVVARLGMDPALLDHIWDVYSFDVVLENVLLQSLNNQADWAIESKLSDAKERPDFRAIIVTEPLRKLVPEAVTLRKEMVGP